MMGSSSSSPSGTGARHGIMVDAVRIDLVPFGSPPAEGFSSTGASFKLTFSIFQNHFIPRIGQVARLRHTVAVVVSAALLLNPPPLREGLSSPFLYLHGPRGKSFKIYFQHETCHFWCVKRYDSQTCDLTNPIEEETTEPLP